MNRILILSFLTAASAPGLFGATITLDATQTGFYNDSGVRTLGNYATGWFAVGSPAELRSYFTFDLTGVSGSITGATVHLSSGVAGSQYFSPDPSETLTFFDVSTTLAALTGGFGGPNAFNDLGTGTSYGSYTLTKPVPSFIDTTLNAAGLAFLNANFTSIALGGAITTLTKGATNEAIFNGTDATLVRQLILTTTATTSSVPEPSSFWTLLLAIPTIALRNRIKFS